MSKRVLVASGQKIINETVAKFDNYVVVGSVEYKSDLLQACEAHHPEILLIGEGLSGHEPLLSLLLNVGKRHPDIRIVYLAGKTDMRDEAKVQALGTLVMVGIYDIIIEQQLNVLMLKNILDNPKTAENVAFLVKRAKDNSAKTSKDSSLNFEIPEEIDVEDQNTYKNLYIVSSIKPGTGKSFLSTNLATAIANFGVETKEGKRPRVALIEADLQNLSVGTLLQIEDDKKNLKTVMEKIGTVTSAKGVTGTLEQVEDVNAFIKSSFKPFLRCKNLEALVGSQLSMTELESIKRHYYMYLIEVISREYDVIVVDTNSSMMHVTTLPLLQMAKSCYYLLNLDFNNVRNNVRYKDFLKSIGISDKIKYVLNEDITNDIGESPDCGLEFENLMFTADLMKDSGLDLEARIPMLPKTVFLNRLYEGKPVVLDDKKYTMKARYEIMKVANQIWPIKNYKEIEEQALSSSLKKKKGLFGK